MVTAAEMLAPNCDVIDLNFGCPAPKVGCADLKDDCTLTFAEVFSSPPEEIAQARVWQHCPKTCDRCKKEKAKKKKGAGKKKEGAWQGGW